MDATTTRLTSSEPALFERLIHVGKLLEKRADRATRREVGLKHSQYEVSICLRNWMRRQLHAALAEWAGDETEVDIEIESRSDY